MTDSPSFRYGDQATINRDVLAVIRHHNAALRRLAQGNRPAAEKDVNEAAQILALHDWLDAHPQESTDAQERAQE